MELQPRDLPQRSAVSPPETPRPFRRAPWRRARPAHPSAHPGDVTAPAPPRPGLRSQVSCPAAPVSRSSPAAAANKMWVTQRDAERPRPRMAAARCCDPPPGPVPVRRLSDAGAGRAGLRGGLPRPGGGWRPRGCGLQTGQIGPAAPPAAPEGAAAGGRTRKGWGRGGRGFPEVGRATPAPPLPLFPSSPPPPPSSLRGAVTTALVLQSLLAAWCLGWAPAVAREKTWALCEGTCGQSGAWRRAVRLRSLFKQKHSCTWKRGVSRGNIPRTLSVKIHQDPVSPLQPAHSSPTEEEGMGAFAEFLPGTRATPLECSCLRLLFQ